VYDPVRLELIRDFLSQFEFTHFSKSILDLEENLVFSW
jgi:hypothetical protein